MRLSRVVVVLALFVSTGCSPILVGERCDRPRRFSRFDFKPSAYDALPRVEVSALPPEVSQAAAAYLGKLHHEGYPFSIINARAFDEYTMLTVTGSCVDCTAWLVYAPQRRCIVGYFTLYIQG